MKTNLEYMGRIVFGTCNGFEYSGTGVLTQLEQNFEGILDSVRHVRVPHNAWFFYSIPFVNSNKRYRLYALAQYAEDMIKRDGYWGAGAAFREIDEAEIRPNTLSKLVDWATKKNKQYQANPLERHDQMNASQNKMKSTAILISNPSLLYYKNAINADKTALYKFIIESNLAPNFSPSEKGFIISSTNLPNAKPLNFKDLNTIIHKVQRRRSSVSSQFVDVKKQLKQTHAIGEENLRDYVNSIADELTREHDEKIRIINEQLKISLAYFKHEISPYERKLEFLKNNLHRSKDNSRYLTETMKQLGKIEHDIEKLKKIELSLLNNLHKTNQKINEHVEQVPMPSQVNVRHKLNFFRDIKTSYNTNLEPTLLKPPTLSIFFKVIIFILLFSTMFGIVLLAYLPKFFL